MGWGSASELSLPAITTEKIEEDLWDIMAHKQADHLKCELSPPTASLHLVCFDHLFLQSKQAVDSHCSFVSLVVLAVIPTISQTHIQLLRTPLPIPASDD